MTTLLDLLLGILLGMLAVPTMAACTYLLVLTLCSSALPTPPSSGRRLRFDVFVPAHDEEGVIERTVASLLCLDWPRDLFRVFVVADNCRDATAPLARAAGAEVLERSDPRRRGKGYALEHAFRTSQESGWADAVVVVDADTVVSANLLEAFAARIEAGAGAAQAFYGALNPKASWRTRLLAIALSAFHEVRSRARERLQLSCGIRGNGWCITHGMLTRVPYRAFSLAEDLEYGIALGLAGCRVHYAGEASVAGEMVSGERASRSQRRRWEGGRLAMMRLWTLPLLKAAARTGDALCLDLALDLLVPPLSWLALAVTALVAVPGAAGLFGGFAPAASWLWLGVACAAGLACHVLRGWQLSGVGAAGLADLASAPLFVVWKVWLAYQGSETGEWIRTRRERP